MEELTENNGQKASNTEAALAVDENDEYADDDLLARLLRAILILAPGYFGRGDVPCYATTFYDRALTLQELNGVTEFYMATFGLKNIG